METPEGKKRNTNNNNNQTRERMRSQPSNYENDQTYGVATHFRLTVNDTALNAVKSQ